MRFGLQIKFLCGLFIALLFSCKTVKKSYIVISSPIEGQNIKQGDTLQIALEGLNIPEVKKITYYIAQQKVADLTTYKPLQIKTDGYGLGFKTITAIVNQTTGIDTIRTNIVLIASKAPTLLSYKVVNSFPHDTTAYTEGLSYVDGHFLESTGEKGKSRLKYVNVTTGKTIKQTYLPPAYFGEGSVKIDNRIIWLTWQENKGFVYNAQTFKQVDSFFYQQSREGWGLTYDGKHLLRSDGTNRIWKMNAQTYKEEGYIEVYNDKGPVNQINELEYIKGIIYANLYQTNQIALIDPGTGLVLQYLDLSDLVPKNFFKTEIERLNNVLNGIAYDSVGKRIFVTGKKWPKLYEIEVGRALH